MGILGGIFESNNKNNFNWIPLTETSQLKEIVELSKDKLVIIFKHSTRCGISSGVLSKFEKSMDTTSDTVAFYYLDLLKYRTISNEIAQKFNVDHQSPQAIFLKDGVVVNHASHYDIISKAINEI
ncbi:bacillithiol system redox-active protein YtxJ [Lutibacter sp. A80]|uniref:bacillithiol system redox-active protein YtxJ n=1 Tax=Lutibacter sp. A80 TaxID=2918453 RepID=UPI001F0561D6|nr:bacillithiol system redox-active protein YtxJ [Lutibacter sp. A80]UMB61479.1 bacillithiol system redox-active protein YtxJ [Lutibacter sp. A80]